MIIGRVIFVEAGLGHLIDEPAIDALIEMRWLDREQKNSQEGA